MLWIALHLPCLSLESFAATLPASLSAGAPLALMDARQIVAANAAARAGGVKPGLKRGTAIALAPQLVLGRADAARDAAALAAVAHAALAFTPQVSCQAGSEPDAPVDTVLLEVRSSLRCFGGPGRQLPLLLRRLHAVLAPLGHRVHVVSAPTPLGAALLARVQRELHLADPGALQAALDAAPVWLLGPGRAHWEALQGMGLRTLGDLRRLPRAGLARRFGAALLDEIDSAYGQRPDPRVPITLPAAFDSRLELFARADTTEQVLHGAEVLLARLVAWLVAQHALVRRCTLAMQHEARWRADVHTPPSTTLEVALAEPSRDAAHLRTLLRERLARLPLPAPTIELQLHASDIARQAPPSGELFPSAASEREGLLRLVERLQARLGPAQVRRLQRLDDHRPERAQASHALADAPAPRAADAIATATAEAVRPVWLAWPPEPLHERQTSPLLDGRPLQLLSGPERIESGWWDGALAERDYFIAQAADGALVWIYRARLPRPESGAAPGWFLQGRFA